MTPRWSEDATHRWLASLEPPAILAGSPGHDAAVLRGHSGRPVLCSDQCLEGVHFTPDDAGAAAGAKAVLRTLSDLAATASRPVAVTLCLQVPAATAQATVQAVIEGARDAARAHGAALVAGDVSGTEGPLGLAVTALGAFEGEAAPPGRDRASAGQLVVLTGPVGGSLPSGRHLRIEPRIEQGRALHRAGATAMMDVSDGLGVDLSRVARASRVRIHLDTGRIPLHPDARAAAAASGRAPLWHGLHDGEDHELVATIAEADLAGAAGVATVIGRVEAGEGLVLARDPGQDVVPWDPRDAWTHGAP